MHIESLQNALESNDKNRLALELVKARKFASCFGVDDKQTWPGAQEFIKLIGDCDDAIKE